MSPHDLVIRRPDDFHLHLRKGDVLHKVLPHSKEIFARALIMPNTLPHPILTAKDAEGYRQDILNAEKDLFPQANFTPLMAIKITNATTPEIIMETKSHDCVIAGKLYPEGVTTNSEDGVRDFKSLYPVFEAMQNIGMVLCVHGESPDDAIEGIYKEQAFLPVLQEIIRDFPKLKIVLEHISTREAAGFVALQKENVAATVTVHHLYLTLDDVIGYSPHSKGKMQPHHFCKPVAKSKKDRDYIISLVIQKNPKFFFGSDSAPHLKYTKECADACAGVFTAPVALPLLAALFEKHHHLENLEYFVSEAGANFYNLPYNNGVKIHLSKESWRVPDEYEGIVPFMHGKTLSWKHV